VASPNPCSCKNLASNRQASPQEPRGNSHNEMGSLFLSVRTIAVRKEIASSTNLDSSGGFTQNQLWHGSPAPFAPLPITQISPANVRSNSVPRIELAQLAPRGSQAHAKRLAPEMTTSAIHVQLKKDTRNRAHLRPVSTVSWDHLGTKTPRFMALFGRLSSARATESSGFFGRGGGDRIASPY
jgi:hypothetical protein